MQPGPCPLLLLPVLVLALLSPWLSGRCLPAFAQQHRQHNDTLPEPQWRWESLFSRSMPGERKEHSRDGDYLLGIKRMRRLYCNVGIGFHIQVLPDGRITGVHNENADRGSGVEEGAWCASLSTLEEEWNKITNVCLAPYGNGKTDELCRTRGAIQSNYGESLLQCLLEISPVERGVVSIYGVKSGLFVAMNSKGKLYGSSHFNDECKFKEILLPNNYNAYESQIYPGMYIALSKNGRTKKGNKVSPTMTVTHFLPRI